MADPAHTAPVMVAIFNQKGGVAKTTSACNLSVCLAAFGYRVLLVDLDTQGNATGSFGFTPLPATGAFEVITADARVEDAALDTAYDGLWLLPATASLRDYDQMLAHAGRHRGLLESRLAHTGVDLVVVDCPPALAAATATALASAAAVLLPARPDPFAHDGLVNTWYEIKRIREGVNAHLGVAGILLTMAGSEPAGEDVARVIRAEFGDQVYPTEIPTDPKVAEAAQLSIPVTVLDPDGPAGLAYVDATGELLSRLGRQNRPGTGLKAPLGRTEALNRLRDWRATTHAALRRMPSQASGWADLSQPGVELETGEAEGNGDHVYAVPGRTQAPGPVRPIALGLLLVGLLTGMILEAVTGLLHGLFLP